MNLQNNILQFKLKYININKNKDNNKDLFKFIDNICYMIYYIDYI